MNSSLEELQKKHEQATDWAYREAVSKMCINMRIDDNLPADFRDSIPTGRAKDMEEAGKIEQDLYSGMPSETAKYWSEKMADIFLSLHETIPYCDSFPFFYPKYVSELPLVYTAALLENEVAYWSQDCWPFFQRNDGGLRYVADVLIEARYKKDVEDTPSLGRAIEWMEQQILQPPTFTSSRESERRIISVARPEIPSLLSRSTEEAQLHNIKIDTIRHIIEECGLQPNSRAGKWAALVSALRRLDLLTGSHAAVQRWLTLEFDVPNTIRRTLSDKAEANSVYSHREERAVLEKAKDLLTKYKK